MSFNSTRYHVDKLAKTGEVVRVPDGGYARIYPASTSERERFLFPLVRRDTDRRILAFLLDHPLSSNKQLTSLTGLAKSTISEHIAELQRLGVVRTQENHEKYTLYYLEAPGQIRRLLDGDKSALKKAGDRLLDLWDF